MRARQNIKPATCVVAWITVAAFAGGCDNTGSTAGSNVQQTGFPGQVSAGSATSGQVMAQSGSATKAAGTPAQVAAPAAPKEPGAAGANAGQEAVRGQSPTGGVSGTPGIPEGSGGTTSGAAMGGTTSGAAATQVAPAPGGAVPSVPGQTPEQQAAAIKKQQAAAKAEQEKQELAASMEKVAERWRSRAKANDWETYPPTPVAAVPGIKASEAQAGPSGQPGGRLGDAAANAPVRSEKHDTAPPSPDVKDPAKKGK
ncbi:MAG TPA: hypothetical protein VGU61_02255 [Noviherbaspirillum sp.]|jgi:hypothetical protein|uniref:hypothetical protein n=1 Tax=Noviherbaspirillum sp. TaxID=1926288 RepID=UPI002DDD1537|nr:hypothetical protein [Noviherbaspirillum sp.]HEV2609064.1 hypothetical protein [Noviherbaspirillum sp.]